MSYFLATIAILLILTGIIYFYFRKCDPNTIEILDVTPENIKIKSNETKYTFEHDDLEYYANIDKEFNENVKKVSKNKVIDNRNENVNDNDNVNDGREENGVLIPDFNQVGRFNQGDFVRDEHLNPAFYFEVLDINSQNVHDTSIQNIIKSTSKEQTGSQRNLYMVKDEIIRYADKKDKETIKNVIDMIEKRNTYIYNIKKHESQVLSDTWVCTVDSKYYQIISNMIISSCKGL
jgi:hypothetical protein